MVESGRRILLQGAVQGCGLRPALARLAMRNDWSGTVRNTTGGVELILQGVLPSDERLREIVADVLPGETTIVNWLEQQFQSTLHGRFQIVESKTDGAVRTQLPRDLVICTQCLAETKDPENRRFGYPFTTCAECGPRYSILLAMPFDRERTTMRDFNLCSQCAHEYHDPLDRRFHAQTISCPECGPHLWLNDGHQIPTKDVLVTAVDILRHGGIVALRGLGGYQLLADATSSVAVKTLRQRKQRAAKPLAILVGSLSDAERIAQVSDLESRQLCSAANPIVVVRQRAPSHIAGEVNPGLTDIGIMLPTTALHSLLLDLFERPLVCTSGNIDGEPLVFRPADAESALRGIADLFIHHNREIVQPIDDSVVRVIAGRPVNIRAARGIAPFSLPISSVATGRVLTACGAQQKNSIAVSNGDHCFLAPHLGDLDTVATQQRWESQLEKICALSSDNARSVPWFVCDAHPGYFVTKWAVQRTSSPWRTWHHHAHIIAATLEHGWLDRDVLGVAWDGTGLGPDGTIWGGEFLLATRARFQRIAHLRTFCLPGGEMAIKDARRLGVAVLSQLEELARNDIATLVQMNESEVRHTQQILNSAFSPVTSSCGRLFDVAALLILNQTNSAFEGHAAMCLEAACDPDETDAYQLEINSSSPRQLDWRPVVRDIIRDKRNSISPNVMATRFHRGLANAILEIIKDAEVPVVLTGGVFQNRVLVEMVAEGWSRHDLPLGLPGQIPPNDGGLAAGQLAIAIGMCDDSFGNNRGDDKVAKDD